MNYLAHLFLAKADTESRVGNLLGDFSRGVDQTTLSPRVYAGLQNHRLVDRFTDHHPEVARLKGCISRQRRRFAGIMLDMAFDHYLIKHWQVFSARPFADCCKDYYGSLREGQVLMPERMQQVTARVAEHDWFSSYATLEGVGFALDRIAERIRFANNFAGAVDELKVLDEEIEASFLRFMPELIDEVRCRGPEVESAI
ncbi:ACP phosphodiesterase [Neptuniibacter caesariensis]|uniref:ACP phosphodiesterase n=1 Tax=Neptuniibacter caesariensis TaxID=207954 RepID=A0A7U8GTZ3_NEPCE|nr:acyl carrier protein phosphodiesterase [Neptuniibacter caesariensis]EAR62635.1 hypothetical protein MED92_05938 [Oceanospirillum sp. MED92] [Neptuniibacter caesariensis]